MMDRIALLPDKELTAEFQDTSRLQIVGWWTEILDRQEKVNLKKARGVRVAQTLLTAAILTVGLSILLVLAEILGARVIAYFAR